MPLLKDDHYTSKDYWSLPEGERAELIDGKFYVMAPPGRIHQDANTLLITMDSAESTLLLLP